MAQTLTQQEAARRIRAALECIESAQWKISDAREAICRICGPTVPKEYDRLGKLYDQIKAHWYSLELKLGGGRFDLDSDAAQSFFQKAAIQENSQPTTHRLSS